MRRFALALAFALLSACSNDGTTGEPVGFDEFTDAFEDAICQWYLRCGVVEDVATCDLLGIERKLDASLVAAVQDGSVIYQPDDAGTCLAEFAGRSCERRDLFYTFDSCELAFEGTVAEGGACAIDEQCISHDCDRQLCSEACCPGTCVGNTLVLRPHLGESCIERRDCIDSQCDDNRICAPLLALGEPCNEGFDCVSGKCDGEPKQCVTVGGHGEPCVASAPTDYECSELNDYCDPTSNVCVSFGRTGDACDEQHPCSTLYKCGSAGTCMLGNLVGDSCDGEHECVDASYCDKTGSMTCVPPQPDGASCTEQAQCENTCDEGAGRCVTPPICT
jgi:hypothetical protein